MKAVIVCGGCICDYEHHRKYFEKAELIIAVDSGARHLRELDIKPNILLGDFDSINEADFSYYKQQGVKISNFPKEKDMTDTELAVEFAITNQAQEIIIIGGLGNRADHSIANIFLLKKILDNGIKGSIVNEKNEILIIKDEVEILKEDNLNITLIPVTPKVVGITTQGLYYILNNHTIEFGSSLGVSNKFSLDIARISIKGGLLMVIKSKD